MNAIETRQLEKIYKLDSVLVPALNGVNLSVEFGEFLAIMGPSGSGKSTLMNLLGCLDRPTRGEVWIRGKRVDLLNDNALAYIRSKEVGFAFQSYNLLPRLTALENVELPLIYQGVSANERRKRALTALERMGLQERAYHKPTQISGGEQQRVALARALVTDPAFILADEPTGNLDSKTGKEILKILQELNKQGITLIIVTHDRFVGEHARRIIQLKDGEIIGEEHLSSPIKES